MYDDKASMVNEYIFIMGSPHAQMIGFIWEALNIQLYDLSHLDAPFTNEEILNAISLTPSDKAWGLDGFTGISSRPMGRSSKKS